MFARVNKTSSRSESHASVTVSKPKTDRVGRERLKYFADQIELANQAVEDLKERCARFAAIIAEAQVAERSLQDVINADGGRSLAAYSAGQTKDGDEIVRLVAHHKTSSEAAAAAKITLPQTEAALENARSQLIELGQQKNEEVTRVVAQLADIDAQAYAKAFDQMCILHDRLVGYANVAQSNIGDIRRTVDVVKAPRFGLDSMGHPDADPFMRHFESSLTVGESSKKWTAIRDRLEADHNADISDLT